MKLKLYELYQLMLRMMSDPNWWPADTKEEIIIGAILVQNTNWINVCKSIANLKRLTGLNPDNILALSNEALIDAIRPSGFYQNKSKAIKEVFTWLKNFEYDYELIKDNHSDLRSQLLKLHGVGFETADSLLLYVFEVKTFIADKYSQRLFKCLGVDMIDNYQKLKQKVILDQFSLKDAQIFHGLIVEFAKVNLKSETLFKNSFLGDKELLL